MRINRLPEISFMSSMQEPPRSTSKHKQEEKMTISTPRKTCANCGAHKAKERSKSADRRLKVRRILLWIWSLENSQVFRKSKTFNITFVLFFIMKARPPPPSFQCCKIKSPPLFQVCRICKNNGRHKLPELFPCHYCSMDCMAKDWPRHSTEIHFETRSKPRTKPQ